MSCRSLLRPSKEDELELEEDDRVDARTVHRGVAVLDEVSDERQVYAFLQAAVEVVRGDQVLLGNGAGQRVKTTLLNSHHVAATSCEKDRKVMLATSWIIRSSDSPFCNALVRF
jgi:hypothetical protein